MSKCSVYLIWCLEDDGWHVVNVCENKEEAEDRLFELMDDYEGEYTITDVRVERPTV